MTPQAEAAAKLAFRLWARRHRAIYPDDMAEERLLALWRDALASGKAKVLIHQPFMSMNSNHDPLHFEQTYTRKELEGRS